MDPDTVRPPSSSALRVVVDATEIVREGVAVLLRDHADRVVLLPPDTLERPDVAIFDPVTQPRATVRSSSGPTTPLVALVWDETARSTARARLFGASQVLRINAPVEDVVVAVERAHREWTLPDPTPPGLVVLTAREQEILGLICRGHTNTEIAELSFLSINSVKTYIRAVYRKIGVSRRSQAVLWGIDHGY